MAKAKRVFCVVAYDVSDDRRRNRIVKILEKYGVRVNYSVYECMFTPLRFQKIQQAIFQKIDQKEDVVIYYPICVDCYTRIVYQPEREQKPECVVMV